MASDGDIRVKALFESKIKVFILAKRMTFSDVQKKLVDLFPQIEKREFRVSFEDEDGDFVQIDSESEFSSFIFGRPSIPLKIKLEMAQLVKAPEAKNTRQICRHFQRGLCARGNSCRFSHQLQGKRSDSRFLSVSQIDDWLKSLGKKSTPEIIHCLSDKSGMANLGHAFSQHPGNVCFSERLIAMLSSEQFRTSMLRERTNRIYSLFSESLFFLELHSFIQSRKKFDEDLLFSLAYLCEEVQSRVANGWRQVPLDSIKSRILEMGDGPKKDRMAEEIQRLIQHRDDLRRRHAVEEGTSMQGSFREVSIIPRSEEMSSRGDLEIPRNKTKLRYNSVGEYLETHFLLLRADCLLPIKEGIRQFCQNIKTRDVRMYNDVKVVGMQCGSDGIETRVSFHVQHNKAVRWESSRRLMFGSLVCFSSDNFNSVTWGTVANRDLKALSNGMTDIRILLDEPDVTELKQGEVYFMAESSSAYFEAYLHVMKSLKLESMERIPFQKHLIDLDPRVGPPTYLLTRAKMDSYDFAPAFPKIVSEINRRDVSILREWPIWNSGLDDSQMQALRQILTKELAIVQGPPGTGKTFIGLLAVKLLLANLYPSGVRPVDNAENDGERATVGRSPILIVCYTNHALDQFLSGILGMDKNLVRMGGQCKDETLRSRDIKELVRARRESRGVDGALYASYQEARSERNEMKDAIESLIKRNQESKITRLMLEGIATEEQIDNLFWGCQDDEEPEVVARWLSCRPQFENNVSDVVVSQNKRGSGNAFDALMQDEKSDDDFDELESEIKDGGEGTSGLAKKISALGLNEAEDDVEEDMEEIVEVSNDRMFLAGKENGPEDQILMFHTPVMGPAGQNAVENENEGEEDMYLAEDEVGLQEVIDSPEVWQLNRNARHILHAFWLDEIKQAARTKLENLTAKYTEACMRAKEIENDIKLDILRECRVLGMTTTGAARHHELLTSLKPKIIVVEEAAEVLEAHILSCLTPYTKHLILIGDHQQLRPSVAVYKLVVEKHLDVSMFERMVSNGVEHTTLSTQRRMRPSISRLISPIYPNLRDHNDVLGRDHIKGVKTDVFFLHHTAEERSGSDTGSKSNIPEAELVVAMCCYLLQQGYTADQVTILTTYTGQLLEIKRRLATKFQQKFPKSGMGQLAEKGEGSAHNGPRLIPRVSSVDNYQGEECDIILLSLVRSNTVPSKVGQGTIGFLSISNRVCVALSRAKFGLYMFGNAELLRSCSKLWNQVFCLLSEREQLGNELVLVCQNHPEKETRVCEAGEFTKVPDGGCSLPCETQLPCGHACPRMCHPESHDIIICPKQCKRNLPDCEHKCPQICHGLDSPCPPCSLLVTKILPTCLHQQRMKCSLPLEDYTCQAACERRLPCGHRCLRKCSQPCQGKKCTVKVTRVLNCGHEARMECFRNPEEFHCKQSCRAELPECHHPCSGNCSDCRQGTIHVPCGKACGRSQPCGHTCGSVCGETCPPCGRKCTTRCVHSICRMACGELCKPCREMCNNGCQHSRCTKMCYETCDFVPCNKKCPLTLGRCGHPCLGLCGEPCPRICRICNPRFLEMITQMRLEEFEVDDRFIQLGRCRHIFEVSGLDQWMKMEDSEGNSDSVAVLPKQCPLCRCPVVGSIRYANNVKANRQRLDTVKKVQWAISAVNDGKKLLDRSKLSDAEKSFRKALSLNPAFPEAHLGLATVASRRSPPDLSECKERVVPLIRSSPHSSCLDGVSDGYPRGNGQVSTCSGQIGLQAIVLLAFVFMKESKYAEADRLASFVIRHDPENQGARSILAKNEFTASLQVIRALGTWYMCPNKHPYTVGECGRPMEMSRCPECGASVGGSSHVPVAGNQQITLDRFL